MTLVLAAGISLITLALLVVSKGQRISSVSYRKKIALEVISHIWTNRKEVAVALRELAQLWRQVDGSSQKPETEEVEFGHNEIVAFHRKYLKERFFYAGKAREVIDRILELLDVHGDCPSVVNARGEVEATLDKNAYDVLAKTTLLQHTLHVAEELLKLIPRGPMTPKAIITALGHDLGKIPIYREKLYSMGDHPLIGITVLDRIKGFNEISYLRFIVQGQEKCEAFAIKLFSF